METMEEKELNQEKEQETNVTDSDTGWVKKVTLSKPFEWEGTTYTEITADFEKLTGADMIAIENEMAALGEFVLSPEVSTSFLSKMAARAAGVSYVTLEHLPLRDFGKIKNMARDFLVGTGL